MSVEFNQWKNQFLVNSTLSQEDRDQLNGDYSEKLQQLFNASFKISSDKVVFGSSREYWPLLLSPNIQRNVCLAISVKGGFGYNCLKVQEYIDREIGNLTTSAEPRTPPVAPIPLRASVPTEPEPAAGSEPAPSSKETLADVLARLCPGASIYSDAVHRLCNFQTMGYFTDEHPEKRNNLSADDLMDSQVMFLDTSRVLITNKNGKVMASSEEIDVLPVMMRNKRCWYLHGSDMNDTPVKEQIAFRTTLRDRGVIEELLPHLNSIPTYHS